MVRTRIAPSPTGQDIHIGNLYTALMNYAWAKKNNGAFIVRIEDTDRERFVEGAEERILGSLKAYGLAPDESVEAEGELGPYRQSERLSLYHKFAEQLLNDGFAEFSYYPKDMAGKKKDYERKDTLRPQAADTASDPPTTIEEMIQSGDWVVRLKIPRDEMISFHDVIRGEITFESNQISNQVLIKSDGYPTYHMAVVVDDHLMEITHVIRAEEWISSTPKHVLLYKALGWDLPIFAHLPILRNPDKSKLSKRKNPVWAKWYLDEGFLPEAVLNYLALMGWSHPEEKEIFSLNEFISLFELKDIKPVGPVFDLVKLRWMNQQYIQNLTDEELEERLRHYYKDDKEILQLLNDERSIFYKLIIGLSKTRMETLKDFKELMYEPVVAYRNDQERAVANQLKDRLSKLEEWNKDNIFTLFKSIMNENSIRMPVLYYIFTGKEKGLPLPEMLAGMGKTETIKRLK